MTAHDTNLPPTTTSGGPAPDVAVTRASRASRHGARDKPAVIVWRVSPAPVDNEAAREVSDAGDSPLTTRMARHLVAIYSELHDTVVDFDADDNLRRAAAATGRLYLSVGSPSDPALASVRPGCAALVVLRWPRPATTIPEQDAKNLLRTCRKYLAEAGSTIIVVSAATAGATGTAYGEHEQVLLAAAHDAGLRHLHDIVPLDADDGRDRFTYATRDTASDHDRGADTQRQTAGTTLVIFGYPGRRP